MKMFFALLVIILLSNQFLIAQIADTSKTQTTNARYDFYMNKHKTNNTIAWCLLVPGTVLTVIGVADATSNLDHVFTPGYNPNAGVALTFLGVGMALGSIPFFIFSGSNRRHAILALSKRSFAVGSTGTTNFNYAAVTLKVQF